MDTGNINPVAHSLAVALATTQQPPEQRAERRQIVQAVQAVNRAEVFGQNNELTFVMDRDTRRPVLKIVNRTTGEVVSQIPPEHVLRLAKELNNL